MADLNSMRQEILAQIDHCATLAYAAGHHFAEHGKHAPSSIMTKADADAKLVNLIEAYAKAHAVDTQTCPACKGSGEGLTVMVGDIDAPTLCDACGGDGELPGNAGVKSRTMAEPWNTVKRDGLPPCDGETVFVGVNEAGYACCFNAMDKRGWCVMRSPEDSQDQMSALLWWRVLDRPDARDVPSRQFEAWDEQSKLACTPAPGKDDHPADKEHGNG
jgi:hypothetical protein